MHAAPRPPGDPGALAGEVVLRDARPGDGDDLLTLWRELMDMHAGLDERFALADDADQRFLEYLEGARERDDYRVRVARLGHRNLGFCTSCILPNSPMYRAPYIGYVNDLCVTAAVRGQGIGRRLVQDAVRWMRQHGAGSVEVYVAHANAVGQGFWRRVGARPYLERLSIDPARFEGPR